MNTAIALAIVAFAGLLHASFQLSISVLTLLSGHSLGGNKSNRQVLRLTSTYLFGAGTSTLLLIATVTLLAFDFFGPQIDTNVWSIASGLVIGVGISVWIFYYRREKGTQLWIPRPVANYLHDRSKHTSSGVESFALGTMTGIGELLFTFAPLLIAGLVLVQLSPSWQLVGLLVYLATSMISLVIVWMLIGGGHKISEIQSWREKNKYFMQFVAGTGLVLLGTYVYIEQVVNFGGV